jgi:hypothetical protein
MFLSSILLLPFISSCLGQSFTNIPTATPDYNLSYNIEGNEITVEITAQTTGYIGFGFTNVSGMVQGDIFIGGVATNGTPYFGVS